MDHDPEEGADQEGEEKASGEEPGEGELLRVTQAEHQGDDEGDDRRQAEANESAADMLVVEGLRGRK